MSKYDMITIPEDVLLINSTHEANLLEMIKHKQYRVAVDVGAHCGLWTRALSKVSSCVIAFEPHLCTYNYLSEGVKTFKNKNVTVNNLAVWDTVGKVALSMFDLPSHSTCLPNHPLSRQVPGNNTPRVCEVESTTLDYYLRNSDINQIDFIKIDVEGAEMQVITGASKLFLNAQLEYVIECHSDESFERISSVLTNGVQANYCEQKYWVNV